jgi:Uma2 family endonuclease
VGLPQRKADRVYTYRDYRSWPDDERWELIHGEAWNMSPAPSGNHQRLVLFLARAIGNRLEGHQCELLISPLDVFLPASPDQDEDDVDTVVQPDLLVTCDPAKDIPKGVWGAPDWVIEILSPYTTRKDVSVKLALYEEKGVREYWIVDPGNRCAHVYRQTGQGRFGEPAIHEEPANITSATCPGVTVKLRELFAVMRE